MSRLESQSGATPREGLRKQLTDALLLVLTAAAMICAFLNFQQQHKYHLPVDGVTWVDRDHGVVALHVAPGSPADNAGVQAGDEIRGINGKTIRSSLGVTRELLRAGGWSKVNYVLHRDLVELEANVIVGVRDPGPVIYYQYLIGAAYLFIGLFVYFRRARAKRALHFYVLCLASFILFTFHYTGKLNNFDQLIYWSNIIAGLLAPTLFLHFCLKFPVPPAWFRGVAPRLILYLPAVLLFGLYAALATGVMRVGMSPVEVRWLVDRIWLPLLMLFYALGALVLTLRYREVKNTVARQQMKWLRNGAIFGIVPFAAAYVIPYTLGAIPTHSMELAVFSMALIPITWAYAVLRYRLMDVDIIFQQGYVYTLTTLLVIGIVYGLVFALGDFEKLSPTAIVFLVLIAAFVFQPIRDWVRDQFDRYVLYKDHYDYRRTLIEFGREVSSETDLDATLTLVADRLMRTLSIRHSAFFLVPEGGGDYEVHGLYRLNGQRSERVSPPPALDLTFLPLEPRQPYLFFEQTRHQLDILSRQWPASVRDSISVLDLTYYLPCLARGKAIAWLGVSRTHTDDFLTSEDLELLTTLCGYVGIAVENARLYRSLQVKVEENERLKEFSENIVESINVGIVAIGLDGSLEGWNAQMQKLTGLPRELAVRHKFSEIFPEDLVMHVNEIRADHGIHHLYRYHLRMTLPVNGNGSHPAAGAIDPEPAGINISTGGHSTGNGNSEPGGNGYGAAAAVAVTPEAREATVNIAVAPLVTRDSHRIGHLIIFDDVTERTQLERQLVQADKLSSIGLLAAGVAHEVNTPLAVISTYAQMLAKQVSGDDRQSALLEKITKQTFRASEIVNSLLNFSRTSTTEFETLDLNQVVRDTLFLIEPQLEKARVRRELDLDPHPSPIKGNPGRLQQVFLNLFLNARDAMEQGGLLRIRTEAANCMVQVAIEDSGAGMSSEVLDRIFDPFFTTKGARKGTGLGLAVSYGIVQEHAGTIQVESEIGRGTRFLLEFPVARTRNG